MMNLTIARITARGLFGRRRFLLLLPLPALLVGVAALASAFAEPQEWAGGVLIGLGYVVVLPVMTLVVGASVLGSEIEDGTAVHILTKPLPRREIVLSKWYVAFAVSLLAAGAGFLVAGLITGSGRLTLGLLAGVAVAAFAYCAVFLALSLVTRRPVLAGLAYILIWEGLLTNLLSGTRVLSIQQYAITTADWVAGAAGADVFGGDVPVTVSVPVALVMTGVVTAGAIVLAIDRLRSFSVAGETS